MCWNQSDAYACSNNTRTHVRTQIYIYICVRAYAGTTFRIGHSVRKRIYLPCMKAKIASWTKCRKIRDTPHLANKKHSTSPWCKGSEEFMWCMWRSWELMKGFTMKTKDLTYLYAVEIYLTRATAIFRKILWNGIRTFSHACPCMSVENSEKSTLLPHSNTRKEKHWKRSALIP